MNRRLLGWWVLTALWAMKIFWLSTESFGGDRSGALLRALFALLHIDVSPDLFRAIHITLRKTAHLVEYGVLGGLVFRALAAAGSGTSRARLVRLSMAIAAAYALSDEIHQAFVRGRGPSVIDWMIDATGAALGIILFSVGAKPLMERVRRALAT